MHPKRFDSKRISNNPWLGYRNSCPRKAGFPMTFTYRKVFERIGMDVKTMEIERIWLQVITRVAVSLIFPNAFRCIGLPCVDVDSLRNEIVCERSRGGKGEHDPGISSCTIWFPVRLEIQRYEFSKIEERNLSWWLYSKNFKWRENVKNFNMHRPTAATRRCARRFGLSMGNWYYINFQVTAFNPRFFTFCWTSTFCICVASMRW